MTGQLKKISEEYLIVKHFTCLEALAGVGVLR